MEKFLDFLSLRPIYMALVDAILIGLALFFAYAIRFSVFLPAFWWKHFCVVVIPYVAVYVVTFYLLGSYKIAWSHASVGELVEFSKQYLIATLVWAIIQYVVPSFRLPRSIFIVAPVFGFIFIEAFRSSWRIVKLLKNQTAPTSKKIIIVGAGEAGVLLAKEIQKHPTIGRVVAFVDDDESKQKKIVAGIQVVGKCDDLPDLIRKLGIDAVYIALPSVAGDRIKKIIDLIGLDSGLEIKVVPSLYEIADGRVEIKRLRSVKLEDLLRRQPVKLDLESIGGYIQNKVVLITGAGGSIGSEITRQVLKFNPRQIIILGHGENSIYQLEEEIKELYENIVFIPVIADVEDDSIYIKVFERYKPQIVFHAAAHKHVPLMEHNPSEAVRVNVFGTHKVAEFAGKMGCKKLVHISTDKAVNPTNVMGATKRLAEILLLGFMVKKYPKTSYIVVRFGNVLGSRGSVVWKFQRQIERGGPVTVTHPEVKRYFMLIPEAVSLVLQAGAIGNNGQLFVLDMGEPIYVDELARNLIRLHGYEPDKDIKIVYTGLRPGEKLSEELFYSTEEIIKTEFEKIFIAKTDIKLSDTFWQDYEDLKEIVKIGDDEATVGLLKQLVPEYKPTYFL